ncbi:terminase B [Paenibacillus sp. BIHB 4019]|uniref:Terminase B n=1 Tax=Paenibacillus sp. BIHB 4019 TaxID=1870819 RepID=A0A1B2DRT3_9BACL|nr:AAA family ATPase [Paenibacillus sp. BIHB 4019]ANY70418.1 terminase B [Paenibacillus sp. BIHB 4019]
MSKPYNVVSTLVELIDLYWDDPVAFAEDMLEFDPDDWQRTAMMDVAEVPLTTIRSGQGVGKTAFESALVIWFLCCRPNPKVICTAPTRQQLHDVLWAEIAKWLEGSKVKQLLKWTKTKIYMIGQEERWFATARTATKPENMQGFHEDYMLFIVDEASGVEDRIMEAILGTLSGDENKLVMCGNPTRTSGVFYDSHNKDRENYRSRRVSSRDSKRTSRRNIAMLESKYGKDSDVIRVRVDGEFPRGESNSFIALEAAEFAKNDVRLQPVGTRLIVGADIARFGDDETSIYGRIGGKTVIERHHHKQDTMQTTGWILRLIDEARAERPEIYEVEIRIDDSGIGGAVTDRLREINEERQLGYIIVPVNNGSSASDEHYGNLGSEMWGCIKSLLEENMSNFILGVPGVLELPDDEKLIAQLSTRKWRMNSNGKIYLERKEDMKKRGLQSPDRADAFVLAYAEVETDSGYSFGTLSI